MQCKPGYAGNGEYCGVDSDNDGIPDTSLSSCTDWVCGKVGFKLCSYIAEISLSFSIKLAIFKHYFHRAVSIKYIHKSSFYLFDKSNPFQLL